MATVETLHITPAEGGAWEVRPGEDAPATSVHATEGQAVASVYEQLVAEPGEAEVIVHEAGGGIRSSMRIRRFRPSFDSPDDLDDPAARAEALRMTPSTARLRAGIARRLPVEGADLEADPADLY
jgi:hypothetical protein